jgi:transcriptional regulator with XRE-family HTH domain
MPKRKEEVAETPKVVATDKVAHDMGELVRLTRVELGQSQVTLGEASGKNQSWVSKIEMGGPEQNMTLRTMEKVFGALGVNAQVVLTLPNGVQLTYTIIE